MSLAAIRQELADALTTTEAPALPYVAETINAPAKVVIPADDYIAPGETFGAYGLRFIILIIADGSTAEATADNLDGMVEDALTILDNLDGCLIDGVAAPHQIALNGTPGYLATSITIHVPITL